MEQCEQFRPERYRELAAEYPLPLIARGQGRSYGDASLNGDGSVVLTERLQRLREFDEKKGTLRVEAGTTMADIVSSFLPRGWFPLITPGTKYVSIGGCVAADVHGKNHHHDGSFSSAIKSLELHTAGETLQCSARKNSDAFWATTGGMGLTGIIGEVTLKMRPVETAYIRASNQAAGNLEQAFRKFEEVAEHPYSLAWIDLQARGAKRGRSVVMLGAHATLDDLNRRQRHAPLKTEFRSQRNVPLDMPQWLLNGFTVGAFNELYYRVAGGRGGDFIVDYDSFFYPLDALGNWNRLYGKRGFVQYQCVIPTDRAYDGLGKLLEKLHNSRHASFLGVLKKMGAQGKGLLSFPMPGYTLAIDLPFAGERTLRLLNELDEVVLEYGGRIYLAKDARLTAESLPLMYPRLTEFLEIKRKLDPEQRFVSNMARRLSLGGAA